MIVDDSSLIRGYLKRLLMKDPQIEICGEAENGEIAIRNVKGLSPDVIILDIEMPVMDGLTALPLLLKESKFSRVIMISALNSKSASLSIEALSKGASDYIEKPSADTDKEVFKEDLIAKIKALADAAKAIPYAEFNFLKQSGKIKIPEHILNLKPTDTPNKTPAMTLDTLAQLAKKAQTKPSSQEVNKSQAPAIIHDEPAKPITPRIISGNFTPEVLAIGSSTGGPQALQEVFSTLGTSLNHMPIFITQHMPPNFTTFLAKSIATNSGINCIEPVDGQKVEAGFAYVAPGDFHMLIKSVGVNKFIKLTKDPQENYCRPSVDPMLRSLVEAYGKDILTVILTGMGQDGLDGARIVHDKGGKVIIQDEASSVVWGMPGAIANAGFQDGMFPLSEIASQIKKICKGRL
jgi:two-component system chemotaxis response regulator CheB